MWERKKHRQRTHQQQWAICNEQGKKHDKVMETERKTWSSMTNTGTAWTHNIEEHPLHKYQLHN